ncbi:hypothetical protein, partial [Enterococcus dongliensis]
IIGNPSLNHRYRKGFYSLFKTLQQNRLKYVFLAAKIIKTARTVIMNLSENYPYKEVYEKCLV